MQRKKNKYITGEGGNVQRNVGMSVWSEHGGICQKHNLTSGWLCERHQKRQGNWARGEDEKTRISIKNREREITMQWLLWRSVWRQKPGRMRFCVQCGCCVDVAYTPQPPPWHILLGRFASPLYFLPPSNMATISVVLWIYNIRVMVVVVLLLLSNHSTQWTQGCSINHLQGG